MKKGKHIRSSIIVLLALTLMVCSMTFVSTVNAINQADESDQTNSVTEQIDSTYDINAIEETESAIQKYLVQNDVEWSHVDLKDSVLTVALNSQGNGHCTLKDVQSILCIYEMIHAVGSTGEIDAVQFYIYDVLGTQIYDYHQSGVSTTIEGKDDLMANDSTASMSITSEDIIVSAKSIASETCRAEVSMIEVQNSNALAGDCLTMILSEDSVGDVTIEDCNRLYTELEAYSFSTAGIKQCSITVQDTNGEPVIYIGGDFDFGNCVMWINPNAESTVMVGVGPAPAMD